jgi:biopolymer transport protein ExbD
MPMKSKARGCGQISFNMVPMIDCIFQLLIFLMVTRHFYEMSTVEVVLPPAVKAEAKRDELLQYTNVVVNVQPPSNKEDNITRVWLDGVVLVQSVEGGKVPDWDPLIKALKQKKIDAEKSLGKKPVNVILRAGENVPYETIGSVMLATSSAGIPNWWVQCYRPNQPGDVEKRKALGVLE